MCAIFGALLKPVKSDKKKKKIENIIYHICERSHLRGRDGFGYIIYYEYHLGHILSTKKTIKSFCKNDINNFMPYKIKNSVLIGNFRAEPTTEYVEKKRKSDQQPYSLGGWSVVHNGTIANDVDIRTNQYKTTIDSAAIVEMLGGENNHVTFSKFCTDVKKIKGSYAILASNCQFPNEIYVAANYKPIYYAVTKLGVFFASSESAFPQNLVPQRVSPYHAMLFSYENDKLNVQKKSLRKLHKLTPKTLIVASGGLDSTVAAKICQDKGHRVELLHFAYGCRSGKREVKAIKNIAEFMKMPLTISKLDAYNRFDSPLLNQNDKISSGKSGAEFANEWVPARNLILLSLAIAIAEARNFDYIALGNNLEESGAYPDNEPEFINQFNKLLDFAVASDKRIRILQPIGNLMKHEIVKLGTKINAPLNLTWSCYRGNTELHCGNCGPCYMRKKAFEINQLAEIVKYENDK